MASLINASALCNVYCFFINVLLCEALLAYDISEEH